MSENPKPRKINPFVRKLLTLSGLSFIGASLIMSVFIEEASRALGMDPFSTQILTGAIGLVGLADIFIALVVLRNTKSF